MDGDWKKFLYITLKVDKSYLYPQLATAQGFQLMWGVKIPPHSEMQYNAVFNQTLSLDSQE